MVGGYYNVIFGLFFPFKINELERANFSLSPLKLGVLIEIEGRSPEHDFIR